MIELREITEENFDECLELSVSDDQEDFVDGTVYALAEAWLHRDEARPLAIYSGDEMVGFLMLNVGDRDDGGGKGCELWRFMIDQKHQGKGYGRAALEAVIGHIRSAYDPDEIVTSVLPGNYAAEKLYESLGFARTGEVEDDGEAWMALGLRG